MKRNTGGEVVDRRCTLCKEWCTSNSTCSDRYFMAWGTWDEEWTEEIPEEWIHFDRIDEDDDDAEPAELFGIPLCDSCCKGIREDCDVREVRVHGRRFDVDNMCREND